MEQGVRRWSDEAIVGPDQRAAGPVPIVEAIRTGDGDERRVAIESALDVLEPLEGRAAVGVEVGENRRRRHAACRFPCDDQPFGGFSHDADAGHRPRRRSSRVGAGIVHQHDLVGRPGLGE